MLHNSHLTVKLVSKGMAVCLFTMGVVWQSGSHNLLTNLSVKCANLHATSPTRSLYSSMHMNTHSQLQHNMHAYADAWVTQ